MKSKIIVLTVVGLLAGRFTVSLAKADAAAGSQVLIETKVVEVSPTSTTDIGITSQRSSVIIPAISMDDVLLTDAIKNLARQAGLNYMLDPKMSYGQPGPDGRPAPQPTVSIRWENLTAEQALMALLNNYDLQLIEDPRTGIARITTKDPTLPDPLVTRIIQLKYADPAAMVVAIQTSFTDPTKRSKVLADIRSSQLVVVATEKELAAIDEMILRLDGPTKQVLIEARIYETSAAPESMKGIDWSGTLEAQNFSFGNNTPDAAPGKAAVPAVPGIPAVPPAFPGDPGTPAVAGTIAVPAVAPIFGRNFGDGPKVAWNTANGFYPPIGFLNADGISGVLSFLNKDTDTRVLSTPRAVTLDNQPAVLSVTRAFPIFATSAGTQGSPGGSQVTYTNLGTVLNVTPRISANNDIQLHVVPEVSSIAGISTKTVAGVINQADIYDFRRIETRVLIPSGTTLVLGGLMSDDSTKGYTKVPIMGDIPGLGFFFRSKSKKQTMRNLLVFITPTIVTPDAFSPTATDFLQSKVEDKPYKEPNPWDSAKPLDWSNTDTTGETSKAK